MISGLRQAVFALVLLVAGGIAAGFFGEVHPAGDSLAAFRGHFVLGVLGLGVLAILLRGWVALGAAVIVSGGAIVGSAAVLFPEEEAVREDLRLYSQNLRFTNRETAAVMQAIRDFDADIVVLQEVSSVTRPVFDVLSYEYQVAEFCPFGGVGGVAVLSRLPLAGPVDCARGQGFLLVPIVTEVGPISFGSVHLPWPWPHRQPEQAAKVARLVERRAERMILAGDFNMAPWGHSVQSIAAASDTRVVPGLRLSFQRPDIWPGLPLDHVLVPEGVDARSELLGLFGSDHHAIGTVLSLGR